VSIDPPKPMPWKPGYGTSTMNLRVSRPDTTHNQAPHRISKPILDGQRKIVEPAGRVSRCLRRSIDRGYASMAKILVVEDDLELSGVIGDWLVADNHSVDIVHNGQEARDRLKQYNYDMTITDWQLPLVTGIELCNGYRASGGTMPILMLTGQRTVENRIEGLDAGADDYLMKPFELSELSARVRALLRRPLASPTVITPKASKHVCPQCAKE